MTLNTQPPVLGGPSAIGPGIGSAQATDTPAEHKPESEWIGRARSAWFSSTEWFNTGIRTQIQKNISNFRSLHPDGSKYRHESFKARSKTFRPKTRALGRRIEAAVAVALFATSDIIEVSAWNQNNKVAQAQAKIKQKLMQYRLEADETWWFLTCIGAAQDGFITGIIISYQYWKYVAVEDVRHNVYKNEYHDGTVSFDIKKDTKTIIIENRPIVDIIPIERFRFDPACDWRDPARTSNFVIYDCPTYVGDAKTMIRQGLADAVDAGKFDDTYWWAIASDDYDSIRAAREGSRIDKYAEKKGTPDAQTISIRKHVHRIDGRDWYWETLGDIVLFKTPQLLTDVFPHLKEGQRPFVTGMIVPETHKVYPTSPTQLIEPLQEEINDVSNLRQDTVKMSTFGRWEVRRNSTVDVATLKAGVPQSVIAVDKIGQDIGELKQREVPQSAFLETDRLQIDLDDVSGGMTQATANSNKALNQDQTLGGMNLLEGQSGQIRELEMRVFVKTWAEPVLQQVHDMIEVYESDEEILGDVAGAVNGDVQTVLSSLQARTRVRINVGFNATTPEKRIGRLVLALKTMAAIFPQALLTANQGEIRKEIFGAVGFDDGERFFPSEGKQDPQVQALQAQIQQLQSQLQSKMLDNQAKKDVAEIKAISTERVATINAQSAYVVALMANKIETSRAYLESIDRQLASSDQDLRTQELQLERTALAHSIDEDERAFALEMHKAIYGDPAPALPQDKPPALRVSSAAGGDKAGTLARNDYGQVPFQEG